MQKSDILILCDKTNLWPCTHFQFKPEVVTESLKQLFEWYETGQIRPHISHKFTLEQAEDALDLLKNRKSTGKVVVKIHKS